MSTVPRVWLGGGEHGARERLAAPGLWEDVGQAREGTGAAQSWGHTHTHPPLQLGLGNGWDWRGKGSGARAVGCWAVGLKVSAAAGGQPTTARWARKLFACGSRIVAPPKDPWNHSHPQGKQQATPTAWWACQDLSLWAPSPLQAGHMWHCAAAIALFAHWQGLWHGDGVAEGLFTPITLTAMGAIPSSPGNLCLGTSSHQGGGHCSMWLCQPSSL